LPLVDDADAPLLFGFTDATSKAGRAGDCACIDIEHAMMPDRINAMARICDRLSR
jgi:hypothetical protein